MKFLYCNVKIYFMRNRFFLISGMMVLVFIFSSCSPQTINNNNPEMVLKHFIKDVENDNFDDAIKFLNPDTVSSRGKIWARRWVKLNSYNIKSIKVEDIRVLGGTAHAKVEIFYKDGKTKDTAIDLIKNNGTWYISPSFSFKEEK